MYTSVRRYPFEAFHFKGEGSYKFRAGPHLPSFSRTGEGTSRGPCRPGAVLAARRGVQGAGNVVPDPRNGVKPPTEPDWREHCCALQSKLHGFQRQF